MKKILIRVDISDKIGGGHLMRMIGLGEFLASEGFEIHIATIPYKENVIDILRDRPFHLHLFEEDFIPGKDVETMLKLANNIQPAWIILDGYQFPAIYEQRIREEGFRSMRVSDLPVQESEADLFLDHNHGAETFEHNLAAGTIKLAGLRHLLLRKEFRNLDISRKKSNGTGNLHLLVCLGGGSPVTDILNLKIVKALDGIKGHISTADVIIGKMGKLSEELLTAANAVAGMQVNIIQYDENISGAMLKADIAITSGGYSMWELLYAKTPFIAVSLNAAQDAYVSFLADEKLCDSLGSHEDITPMKIRKVLTTFIEDNLHRNAIIEKSEMLFDRENNGRALIHILTN